MHRRPLHPHESIRARIRMLESLERQLDTRTIHIRRDLSMPYHLYKPRLYCASPLTRRAMWEPNSGIVDRNLFKVVSTWHTNPAVESDDDDPTKAYGGWLSNVLEIRHSKYLLAYAEHKDRPNGTLVEIGCALAHSIPVLLVGNHEWGSWRTMCREFASLREACDFILKNEGINPDDQDQDQDQDH